MLFVNKIFIQNEICLNTKNCKQTRCKREHKYSTMPFTVSNYD